jgi:A/G-specific adenine glycosylase
LNLIRFAQILTDWHEQNKREMPWAGNKDPYKIWISEIILQQTRVRQGWDYYLRFIQRFPDVFTLHAATENEVLHSWEGLGYYSRARNLKKSAAIIVKKYGGNMPDSYEKLLELPGIGPYTASAIAGFAFDLPHAVMDGNVTRFISRLLALEKPVQEANTKQQILDFVNRSILHAKPSLFNQAIMNFGAMICKPSSPECTLCPFSSECLAFRQNRTDTIPVKSVKTEKKQRHFHYFVIQNKMEKQLLLCQRNETDIWKGLYEFPMIEEKKPGLLSLNERMQAINTWMSGSHIKIDENVIVKQQELTHQKIHFYFYLVDSQKSLQSRFPTIQVVQKEKLTMFPMPVTLKNLVNANVFPDVIQIDDRPGIKQREF